jgi:hypothetical protein
LNPFEHLYRKRKNWEPILRNNTNDIKNGTNVNEQHKWWTVTKQKKTIDEELKREGWREWEKDERKKLYIAVGDV